MDNSVWTIASTNTWSVVITGLLVVFIALIALVVLVWILGKIFETIDNSKKPKQEEQPAQQAVVTPADNIVTETDDEQDDSVIAAISAAISSFFSAQGNDKPFAIKSIKRINNKAKTTRSAWNAASISDNTRPF